MSDFKTRQQLYDYAYLGIAAQGFRQSMGKDGMCRYLADDGCRCAIGHNMTEEEAKWFDAEIAAEIVASKVIKVSWDQRLLTAARIRNAAGISPDDQVFSSKLQEAHDDTRCSAPELMKLSLIQFAQVHGLTVPILETGTES